MTLEELQNKKVTITVNKTFRLGDDLSSEILFEELQDQLDYNLTNEEVINNILSHYFSSNSDLEEIIESDDFKVTIYD